MGSVVKTFKKVNLNKLQKVFRELNNDKTNLGITLVKEAMFMQDTLNKLKNEIEEKGTIVSMCQGNYDIDRANPALQSYNSMIKNYQSCIKQIVELLPQEDTNSIDDFDNDDL